MKTLSCVSGLQLFWLRVLIIAIGLIVASCAGPKRAMVKVESVPIPPLRAKIYEAPGVDWSHKWAFALELRELGKPDTASNQILEGHLSRQIEDCLFRIGYSRNDSVFDTQVRLFFGVTEEKITVKHTLAYGYAGTQTAQYLSTSFQIAPGTVWYAAQVASAKWSLQSSETTESQCRAAITIEIFDRDGETQLWRGDIETPTSTDDIRVVSPMMIRELLWYLPALDYPAVSIEEMTPAKFDEFWNGWVLNREFYSPGQRYPLNFDYGYYETPATVRDARPGEEVDAKLLKQAKTEFSNTPAYRQVEKTWRKSRTHISLERTFEYQHAFRTFVLSTWNPRATKQALAAYTRYGFAIADLLMTAPWSLPQDEGQRIVFGGRYFVGGDETPVILLVEARPCPVDTIDAVTTIYEYNKYFVTQVRVVPMEEFAPFWRQSLDHRETVFGRSIDLVPQEPTPAVRRS